MKKPSPKVIYLNRLRKLNGNPSPPKGKRKLPKPVTERQDRCPDRSGPPADKNDNTDPSGIRAAWVECFGRRLDVNNPRGFHLDGRPISLDELMIITNRIRRKQGLGPVGKKPGWIE